MKRSSTAPAADGGDVLSPHAESAAGKHVELVKLQAYLRHFGFLAPQLSVEPGRLDSHTAAALASFQQAAGVEVTGVFDEATRAVMARPRCGVTSPRTLLRSHNDDVSYWDRRDLSYAFNNDTKQDIGATSARREVRRAFNAWEAAGAELRFSEVAPDQDPDILIEWRPADDPDGDSMVGGVAGHADGPPGFDGHPENPPLRLHFDDDEPDWNTDAFLRVDGVAMHEIGHNLGLSHGSATSVMWEFFPGQMPDGSPPALTDEDLSRIRALYPRQGPEYFNFIWMKGSQEREAVWGLTRQALQDEAKQKKDAGFVPGRINTYVHPTQGALYNAVFDRIAQERNWLTNRTLDELTAKHAEFVQQGYRMVDINSFVDPDGEVRWNGIWIQQAIDATFVPFLPFAEFDAKHDALKEQDYRPIALNACVPPDGVPRWSAVYVKQGELGPRRTVRSRFNYKREDFDREFEELRSQDFIPTDINAFVLPDGGGERWNAIFEKIDNRFRAQWGWGRVDAERRIANLNEGSRDPWIINAYVVPQAHQSTSTVSLPQTLPSERAVTLGLAVDEERIYATRYLQPSEAPGKLVVIDRQSLEPLPLGDPDDPGISVGHGPGSVALNQKTGKIYVVNSGAKSFSVSVIDAASLELVKTIAIGQGPGQIAVNSRTNRVYVSNWFQRRIEVIDGATDVLLAPIPIGPGPQGLCVDETSARVYVALSNRSFAPHVTALGVITDTGSEREIHPLLPLGHEGNQPIDVAVDPVNDRVYILNMGGGPIHPNLVVLHRTSLTPLRPPVRLSKAARQLALSSHAREVYVTCDDAVQIVDAVSFSVRSLPVGKAPWAIAAAPGTARQVFVGDRLTGDVTRIA